MAQEPLATKGNFLHIYDFRVEAGREEEFVRLFEEFESENKNIQKSQIESRLWGNRPRRIHW